MESTTRLHDGIANTVFQEAYLVFDDTVAFHPTNRVFDTDADGRDGTIGCFLWWGEFPSRGLFLGLDDGDPLARIALEAHVLIETTTGWEGIALQLREDFIMYLSFIGDTQEANLAGLIDHEEVFERVALLLATVVLLLVLGIGWAVDRPLRTIMPKRGDGGAPVRPFGLTSQQTLRRCELEATLGRLRHDLTPHGGGESTYWHWIVTSQRADLALLE